MLDSRSSLARTSSSSNSLACRKVLGEATASHSLPLHPFLPSGSEAAESSEAHTASLTELAKSESSAQAGGAVSKRTEPRTFAIPVACPREQPVRHSKQLPHSKQLTIGQELLPSRSSIQIRASSGLVVHSHVVRSKRMMDSAAGPASLPAPEALPMLSHNTALAHVRTGFQVAVVTNSASRKTHASSVGKSVVSVDIADSPASPASHALSVVQCTCIMAVSRNVDSAHRVSQKVSSNKRRSSKA